MKRYLCVRTTERSLLRNPVEGGAAALTSSAFQALVTVSQEDQRRVLANRWHCSAEGA